MRRRRVVRAYRSAYPRPLRVRRGERLEFERRPSAWEGWIWCARVDGAAGWAPETWVAVEGNACRFVRDYDASELTVEPGDEVLVEEVVAGWAWCRRTREDSGWLPISHLAD